MSLENSPITLLLDWRQRV